MQYTLIKIFTLAKSFQRQNGKKSLKIQLKSQFEELQFICSNELEELQWDTDQFFFFLSYNFRAINVIVCDLV